MRIIKISKTDPHKLIVQAVQALRKGKVLVCPTDTIYGLIGDATNAKTVEKIFRIKQRKKEKPLGIFVKNLAMAKRLARVSPLQEKFLKKVWPGKVTAVLHVKRQFPKGVGTQETIGIRVPKYPFLDLLFEKFNHALVQTSVNISKAKPLEKVEDMVKVFGKRKFKPDLILDAGTLSSSRPSTVIDITTEKRKIVRT